ncbi:hypothetical protein [uncultured Gemmiger sp.]|uniref:hypothetical protein n=1 Tax=uncultured Gemmiger sp. TaxID=1623490 RepID=UPI0025993C7D|nr:hypothetical protein [uncultured Gemmiger sp.]
MMIKHERTITDDLVDKWREALATPVARKRIKDGKPSTAYVHSELEIPSDDAYPYETRLLNISGKAKELHLSTKSRGDKVSSYFCITSSKQLRIDLSGLNLNGISYQKGSYIEITPERNKKLSIRFDGKTYDASLMDVSFSDMKQQFFAAKKF